MRAKNWGLFVGRGKCLSVGLMSVLFQALSKAAQEFRDRSLAQRGRVVGGEAGRPVDEAAVVVPLWTQPREGRHFKVHPFFLIAIIGLGLLTAVGVYLWPKPATLPAPPQPAIVAAPMPVPAPPAKPTPAKQTATGPSSIVLSGGALALDGPEEETVAEVARQLEDLPPAKRSAVKAKPSAHVVVEETTDIEQELAAARAAVAQGNDGAALRAYDRMLARNPANIAALKGKVYVLEQNGTASALAALQDIVAAHESFAPAQAALARMAARRGQMPVALSAWQRAVALDPANRDYRLSLAILYDQSGEGDKALSLYRQLPQPLPETVRKRIEFLSSQTPPDTP